MKKIVTSIFIILLTLGFTFAQAPNKKIVKKATAQTEYVSTQMSLDETKSKYLFQTILDKMISSAEKTKGLSKEEKKPIKKEINKAFVQKLKEQFSKEEITKIKEYIKEYNQKKKEEKNNIENSEE